MARQFAVLGLGKFGSHVARQLAADDFEVLAVDRNPDLVDEIKDEVTRAAIADVTDAEALQALGLDAFEAVVVALGGSLEGSILTCLHLRELGCKHIVAKVFSPQHERILRKLGIGRVIYPEHESALRLAKHLGFQSVLDFLPLAPGFSLVEIAPPSEIVGKSLRDAQIRQRFNVQVVAIRSLVPEQWHLVPDPNMVIKDSDVLVVIGKDEDLNKIAKVE
ncbi:MAG: TrkA family potassium uptake protein [Planctomycetota bacterium]|nr:TrkA family potassium uptake protein [Planctomycetota bacterium]